jgi:Outer membrane protein beta-barrel domain
MNRQTIIASAMLLSLSIAAPAAAQGYRFSGIGLRLGYVSPEDLDGTASIGGQVELERPGSRWHLMPGLNYWQSNDISDINPNVDAYYHFEPSGTVTPYLGAGLGLHAYDRDGRGSETDLGANLFGGIRFPGNAAHSFLETRYTISDRPQFALQGGALFHY